MSPGVYSPGSGSNLESLAGSEQMSSGSGHLFSVLRESPVTTDVSSREPEEDGLGEHQSSEFCCCTHGTTMHTHTQISTADMYQSW